MSDSWNNFGIVGSMIPSDDGGVSFAGEHPEMGGLYRRLRACLDGEDFDGASAAIERMLALQPSQCNTLLDLAANYGERRKPRQAESVLRGILRANPDDYATWSNLGLAMLGQDRLDEAMECFERAKRLQPRLAVAHVNMGNLLVRLGRHAEAMEAFDQALEIDPQIPLARTNRALTLLHLGRFTEGWKEYRWRYRWQGSLAWDLRQRFAQEPWDGRPLDGRRILIYGEQGAGDILQLIRYVPMVVRRGGRVLLEMYEPLVRLLRRMPGVEAVVPPGVRWGAVAEYSSIMDLPDVFATTAQTIPAEVPYLDADPADIHVWRQRLEGFKGMKVALVWAGGDATADNPRRSLDATLLRPLLEIPAVAFFSLQLGRGDDVNALGADAARLTDLSPHLRDYADTAAALSQMDLLISVDTSTAHLAGAMARPTWTMLMKQGVDWRWLDDREDCPWYPTMRLFRQTTEGDWPGVIRRVAEALRAHVAGHRS